MVSLLAAALLAVTLGCDTGVTNTEDIQVYFSPHDKCDEKVVELIDRASQVLDIAVYSFNRKNIADAVVRAYERKVRVRVITDAGQATGSGSQDTHLEQAGIPVKRDGHPGYGAMHHKFAVIDNRIVITGSYNWTTNATMNNDENLAVITSTNTAARYSEEFERLWQESH